MHPVDKLALIADLQGSDCVLNHGSRDHDQHRAINCIILSIGYRETADVEVEVRDLTIPICRDCAHGLCDDDWTLIFCIECCASQWILRPIARLNYGHHIIWLKGCPECSGKFGGIYFNDQLLC